MHGDGRLGERCFCVPCRLSWKREDRFAGARAVWMRDGSARRERRAARGYERCGSCDVARGGANSTSVAWGRMPGAEAGGELGVPCAMPVACDDVASQVGRGSHRRCRAPEGCLLACSMSPARTPIFPSMSPRKSNNRLAPGGMLSVIGLVFENGCFPLFLFDPLSRMLPAPRRSPSCFPRFPGESRAAFPYGRQRR